MHNILWRAVVVLLSIVVLASSSGRRAHWYG